MPNITSAEFIAVLNMECFLLGMKNNTSDRKNKSLISHVTAEDMPPRYFLTFKVNWLDWYRASTDHLVQLFLSS